MSLTKAAQYLQCSKAHISKRLASLERTVGTPLLHRNTRTLKLTYEGESLFIHAKTIIQELQFAQNTIHSLQHKAAGTLRITSPSGYADYLLAPHISQFLNDYPDINLDMYHCGTYLDLIKEKIDIAIRITHEPPEDKIARRLGSDQMILCASPAYLEKYGKPGLPTQLSDHDCLVYSSEKSVNHWPFVINHELVTVNVKPKLISNNLEVPLQAALSGFGIARLPKFSIQKHLESNELTAILTDFNIAPTPIFAIYSPGRIIPPKIHAFIKFLEFRSLQRICAAH